MRKNQNPMMKGVVILVSGLLLVSSYSLFPQTAYASDLDSPLQLLKDTVTSIETHLVAVSSATTAGATGVTAVTSVEQLAKNTILDPLAWAVSKAVLQSVVNSTVNWINHGFNGAPSFTTNLNSTLQAVGDSAANNFISQLSTNGSIKSPFQTQIASAVSTNYLQSTSATGFFTQNAYTLNQVTSNDSGFLKGNFSDGGWNAWMSAVINPQNNPYGAYVLASNAASQQVAGAQKTQSTELNWAKGFLSSRGNCPTSTTGGSTGKTSTGGSTSLSQNSTCQSSSIQTPGTVIEGQLEKSLGSGIDTLVTANQFDEIVNALLGQLTKQIIGPGGGLAGVSQSSSATGGTTYFAQTDPSQAAINATLGGNFASTTASQLASIQQFQTEWTTINNAAQTALSALTASGCYPNAQTTIANTVQPVINEAAESLSQANSSITALKGIQAELPNPNSTTDQTAALNKASNDYSTISSSLPTPEQLEDAQTQSADDSSLIQNTSSEENSDTTSAPQISLYTQMNELTSAAESCQVLNPLQNPHASN